MKRTARLGQQEIHALRALVVLARDPAVWRSVTSLAEQQDLPAAMLEQLLLRLRRAGLLEARRGRLGGYRLSRDGGEISLAMILRALALSPDAAMETERDATERVAAALERRLQRALERELSVISLEDLVFDLRSSEAELADEGGLMLP